MNNKERLPLVSICVQTYNHQNFIAECLDSILMQQTTFPFEIILGEDNSDDTSRSICVEYAKKHPQLINLYLRERKDVIYIEGKPTGRFNFTENLKSCKGKYIAICEGDDYWTDERKLQKQVDFLEKNNEIVGCFHNSILVDFNGKIIEQQYFKFKNKLVYNQEDCLKEIKSGYATCSLMYRRDLLHNQIDTYKEYFSDFFIELLLTNYGNIAYMDYNMSAYRIHSGGIWQGSSNLHNLKVILRRYLFLYSLENFNKKYNNFLWENIIKYFDTVINASTTKMEKNKYSNQRLKFLNFFDKRTYIFFLKKIERSIHYRIKKIKNRL